MGDDVAALCRWASGQGMPCPYWALSILANISQWLKSLTEALGAWGRRGMYIRF